MLIASPATYAQIVHLDAAWLQEHRAEGVERWNRWISA
jgi:hypothetical protein